MKGKLDGILDGDARAACKASWELNLSLLDPKDDSQLSLNSEAHIRLAITVS